MKQDSIQPRAITITRPETAELLPVDFPEDLPADHVRGPTLVSLVSPGTEIAHNFKGRNGKFPSYPGYASVFEVRELGAEVTDLKKGDWVFSKGGHRNLQQEAEDRVVKLPGNLRPEVAVIARLIGVSTATLVKTAARPDDKVLITGAGPVGYLCAHQFQIAGYRVHLVDVDEDRREMARRSGIRSVTGKIPEVGEDVESRFAAAIDCSGHEDAVLDGACAVRKGGEVIIIGLPWRPHADLTARDLLQVVFTNYLNLRSGWEWELPMQPEEFRPHSIFGGYRTAFRWLSEGRIPTEDAIEVHSPEDA